MDGRPRAIHLYREVHEQKMYANAPTDHNLWRRARQYMRGSASDVAVMLVRLARTKKVTRHVSCYAELLRVGSRALMTGDQGVEQTGNRKQTERRSVEDSRNSEDSLWTGRDRKCGRGRAIGRAWRRGQTWQQATNWSSSNKTKVKNYTTFQH